jgi:hypothetical protein
MCYFRLPEGNRSCTLVMLGSILSTTTYSGHMFRIACQESLAKNAEGRRDSQTFRAQLRADAAAMGGQHGQHNRHNFANFPSSGGLLQALTARGRMAIHVLPRTSIGGGVQILGRGTNRILVQPMRTECAPMARVCLSLCEQRFLAPLICLSRREVLNSAHELDHLVPQLGHFTSRLGHWAEQLGRLPGSINGVFNLGD